MKKTKKLAFGGMPAPMAKPMGPSMGPKPQIMGGSSNKMGPDSMKTGVPSNPANMSIAKPPGLTGAGFTKFTGPPIVKTAENFKGLTPPSGRPTINPNSPGVMKAPTMPPMTKGPMAGDMGHAGRLKKGGEVKASKRADGCAIRGKTKGRMV